MSNITSSDKVRRWRPLSFSSFSSSFVALFMLPQGFPISWTTETYSGGPRLDFSSVDGTIFHFLMSAQSCAISASDRPGYASLYFQQLFPETDRTHEDRGDGLCASELSLFVGLGRKLGFRGHMKRGASVISHSHGSSSFLWWRLSFLQAFPPPLFSFSLQIFHVNILRGGRHS